MDVKETKKSILESENFEKELKELRAIAERIKQYTEEEERLRWQQRISLEQS
jgi:cell shape-determining protein MreC